MNARALVRRYVPYEVRLRIAIARRAVRDRRSRVRFAKRRGARSEFPYCVCSYERAFIDYPGQEEFREAKRRNQALLAGQLTATLILPGETFSIWRLAKRPTARAGYLPAAALKDRELTAETGGAICLLSTVLYNVGLLGALEVPERHCHSVDSYGDRRYFELARDAAIEFGYKDLRLRNPHDFAVLLVVEADKCRVSAGLYAAETPRFAVEIDVGPPERLLAGWEDVADASLPPGEERLLRDPLDGLRVGAVRRVKHASGHELCERLPGSLHHPVPGRRVHGPAAHQRVE